MEDNYINLDATLSLINAGDDLGESFASISLNPLYQWAKIVTADSLPNANKQGIPEEEFDNLIKTGINSPIKMARGKISLGHEEAFGNPIGTIAKLTKEGNKIIALAALWKKERPEDIAMLKKLHEEGKPPQVSWEISYSSSELDDQGVEWLKGTILNGLAVVGMPAYQGRTSFVAMSSKQNSEELMEELEQLKQQLAQLKEEMDGVKASASTKEKELTDAISEKEKQLEELNKELEQLKQYKASVEAEKEKAEKLDSIKKKFTEAGLEKGEEYFTEKAELLLSMDENALDFMIQEMVSFAELAKNSVASFKKKVPNFKAKEQDTTDYADPREIGRALRESYKSK